ALYRQVADALGVSVNDAPTMDARLSGSDASLNAQVANDGENSSERQDCLVSDDPPPDEVVSETIDGERRLQWLNSALQTLNPRELRIIRERRLRDEGATLESLGSSLGISKERVRQIEGRAIEKLRIALVRSEPNAGHHAA